MEQKDAKIRQLEKQQQQQLGENTISETNEIIINTHEMQDINIFKNLILAGLNNRNDHDITPLHIKRMTMNVILFLKYNC